MPTLTMTPAFLRSLVLPVMPMVSEQATIHALESVRIRTEPGRVIAEGVSGMMLGMCVRPLDHTAQGFDIVFPINELPVQGLAHAVEAIGFEQTTTGTVIVEWVGVRAALREYDVYDPSRFPDVTGKIIKALEATDRTRSASLTAEQMKAFAVCAERANNPHQAPLVIHPGPTVHDMILVTCGDHFAGLATAASNIRHQPTRTKLRMPNPPGGDPIDIWKTQLSTLKGE